VVVALIVLVLNELEPTACWSVNRASVSWLATTAKAIIATTVTSTLRTA
jgi:hypothetical protein